MPELWTQPQRRFLALGCLVIAAIFSYRLLTGPAYIPDPQPDISPRAYELPTKLDPNIATQSELAILPDLGDKRAAEIVAYRTRYAIDHPTGRPAFVEANDLLKVNGIGVAMLENLEPYLTFPTCAAATRP